MKKFQNNQKIIKKLLFSLSILQQGNQLPVQFNNHKLRGVYEGYHEFHLFPDILVVYTYKKNALVLIATRLGSHSELYG